MKRLGNKSLSAFLATAVNVIWWLEILGGCTLTVMVFLTAYIRRGFALQVPVTYSPITIKQIYPVSTRNDFSVLNTNNGILSIHVPANWQTIVLLLIGYGLLFGVIVLITYQLKKLLERFSDNQPFHSTNRFRIRNVAFALLGYSVAQWIFTIVVNQILLINFNFKHMELTYDFNISCFLIGLVILVLEGIFKAGSALEEEQQFVI
jgi:hypothetical protein